MKIKYFGYCSVEGFLESLSEYLDYTIEKETKRKTIKN